jgi:colanic acid biosynthesis glycosyl transferase WcaI
MAAQTQTKSLSQRRLLVFINNYPPDRAGGAAVIGDMCQGLAERGFDVTVRCAYPYYPQWKDKSGRNGWRIWRYRDGSVSVERYGLFIPRNPSRLLPRLLHELSLFLSLLRGLGDLRRFDLMMGSCTAVTAIGRLLVRRPFWLNVQDLAAEAAVESGLLRAGWLAVILRRLQAFLFNRADVWSTISPAMAERLAPLRSRAQPLLLQPNWLNQSLAQVIDRFPVKSGILDTHRPPRLLYAGNIGKKQNLLELLVALHRSSASFDFTIYGDGALAFAVRDWIDKSRDPRFRYGPFQDEAGFAGALAWADFFVITETPDAGASFMPSKLVPGIASGTPILAVCGSGTPLGREVRDFVLGPHFSWPEVDRVAMMLAGLVQHPGPYTDWVRNAYRRARDYNRDAILDRFARNLRAMSLGATVETDY